MTPREKLQAAYELAFHPPAFNRCCRDLRERGAASHADWAEVIDMALSLHLALPQRGYASPAALHRLAHYQARSRGFGMPLCLVNLRRSLPLPGDPPTGTVPGHLVRDIGLPPFMRPRANGVGPRTP
jgi:hypothetical protein